MVLLRELLNKKGWLYDKFLARRDGPLSDNCAGFPKFIIPRFSEVYNSKSESCLRSNFSKECRFIIYGIVERINEQKGWLYDNFLARRDGPSSDNCAGFSKTSYVRAAYESGKALPEVSYVGTMWKGGSLVAGTPKAFGEDYEEIEKDQMRRKRCPSKRHQQQPQWKQQQQQQQQHKQQQQQCMTSTSAAVDVVDTVHNADLIEANNEHLPD
ncbi:hypothetical protein ACFE04_003577 [Oxalis oulophora]